MKNIIVLEDNKEINAVLCEILQKEEYNVFPSYNAFNALNDLKMNKIDCILTDLMLPIMSGEEFIQEVRKQSNVHIIVISAKTASIDKIEGLKMGADDYLYKPFLEEEIIIKLRNLFTKRDLINKTISFNNKEIVFENGKPELLIKGTLVPLTSVEYQMVQLLIHEESRVVTRNQFLDVLYSYGDEVFDRVVDVHIRNIRRKIKEYYTDEVIKTLYGLGYSWVGVLDE